MENSIPGQFRTHDIPFHLAQDTASGQSSADVNGRRPHDDDSASDSEDGASDATAHEPARCPSVGMRKASTPYRIIHRVKCRKTPLPGEDHSMHLRSADFLDAPRLWAKDSRASALRGLHSIDPDSDLWHESRVKIVREYSCISYHQKFKKRFKPLLTSLDRQVYARIQPWIDTLTETAPEAKSETEYILISDELLEAIDKHIVDPSMGDWRPKHDLSAPYNYFYHFRHTLRDVCAPRMSRTDRKDLGILLQYIEDAQGEEFNHIQKTLDSGKIKKDMLSKLFAPNEVIGTMEDDKYRAYISESSTTASDDRIVLSCWTLVFDGSFKKQTKKIAISWPDKQDEEEISIESLSAWPLRYDTSGLEDRLIKRGKEFWKCRHRRLICYQAPSPSVFELHVTNPKYMIDYKTYRQIHRADSQQPLATEAEMLQLGLNMASEESPGDITCTLMPSTIVGYAFHDKKWRTLSMDHVEEVEWNHTAFNRLVLSPNKKDTIRALISVHLSAPPEDFDMVENKGNGLIMLLHGSPGTGKTLTAESVAEAARKPLYRVTCGDVGTNPESVEKYLESVVLIGSIWACVVLLDEADVFLEERQVSDLARNALVSIFLRILEYYPGILILTTNRVGTFDEAFKSRVHLAIHYPALNQTDRSKIWHNFIATLKEKGMEIEHDELIRQVPVLAQLPFNGRQIRNCLWTAAQVAKHKGQPLGPGHLDQVVEISQEFEEYLRKTRHGYTDEERAKAEMTRHS